MNINFLNYEDFKTFFDPDKLQYDKAKTISKYIKQHWIVSNGDHYRVNENIIYEKIYDNTPERSLCAFILKYLSNSFTNLSDIERECLKAKYKKWNTTMKCSYIYNMITLLIDNQTKNNIFYHDPHTIHFKNGYMCLNTGKFNKRILGEHYITCYCPYDYTPSTEKNRTIINNIINKILDDKIERDFMMTIYGASMDRTFKPEMTLFQIGKGSAGKSTLMNMLNLTFGEKYYGEFSASIFQKNPGSDRFKQLNDILDKDLRYMVVNELDGKTLDESFFKSISDRTLVTMRLYRDGKIIIQIPFLMMTANVMPTIKIDSGTTRRILSYYFRNIFTEEENIEEMKNTKKYKNVYKKDKDVLSCMSNNAFKCAFFDILLKYCLEYKKKWSKIEYFRLLQKNKG